MKYLLKVSQKFTFTNTMKASEWMQQSSEVTSSKGCNIVKKQDDEVIKEVRNVSDVVDFILYEMNTYI